MTMELDEYGEPSLDWGKSEGSTGWLQEPLSPLAAAEDIGAALGCGAHVSRLHRSCAGPFNDQDAQSVDVLEAMRKDKAFAELDALLLPVSRAVAQYPAVELPESSAFYLRQGRAVMTPGLPDAGLVALLERGGGFLGVGEVLNDGRVTPRRLLS